MVRARLAAGSVTRSCDSSLIERSDGCRSRGAGRLRKAGSGWLSDPCGTACGAFASTVTSARPAVPASFAKWRGDRSTVFSMWRPSIPRWMRNGWPGSPAIPRHETRTALPGLIVWPTNDVPVSNVHPSPSNLKSSTVPARPTVISNSPAMGSLALAGAVMGSIGRMWTGRPSVASQRRTPASTSGQSRSTTVKRRKQGVERWVRWARIGDLRSSSVAGRGGARRGAAPADGAVARASRPVAAHRHRGARAGRSRAGSRGSRPRCPL